MKHFKSLTFCKSSKVLRDQSWFTHKNLHLSLVLLTKKIELRVNIHVWSSSCRITIISISIDFNWWAPDILSKHRNVQTKQECIPVGCVLPTAVAILRGCLPGGGVCQGVSALGGVSAQGGCVCLVVCVCQGCTRHPCGQTPVKT